MANPGGGTVAAPPATGGGAPPATREPWTSAILQAFLRGLMLYLFLRNLSSQSEEENAKVGKEGTAAPTPMSQVVNLDRFNLWAQDTDYEVRVFTSLSDTMDFNDALMGTPVYAERSLTYAFDEGNSRAENLTLRVPTEVSTGNSSWFAHVFAAKTPMWGREEVDNNESVLYSRHDIISWKRGPLAQKEKSLLEDAPVHTPTPAEDEAKAKGEESITQLWKPVLPITIVVDGSKMNLASMPAPVQARYRVAKDVPGYFPPFFVNEFWLLGDMMQLMNDTVESVTVEASLTPVGLYKFTLLEQFEATMEQQASYGASSKSQNDKVKRMFLETNPILLGTTMCVSVAHSVLEMLAFKTDISHWKSIKSIEGISVRSMMVKIFMEIVIFLYLWDNDTSWMIIIGNAVGIAIELWKLGKAVEFKNFGKRKLLGFIPFFEMKDRASYSKKTKEYDDQAMRYLSYVAYPLMVAYSIYSLVYEKHKSWYSWILGSLVGTVYTFGFIMMFPQIFINYKLKSVAHLPVKAMAYKFLSTIIDDLFAFVIKMPWLHRLATLRDDVVFLIVLYQRYIYPVDTSRVNEFGQSFDQDGNEVVRPAEPETAVAAVTDATTTADSSSTEVKPEEKKEEENSSSTEGVEQKPAELKKNE